MTLRAILLATTLLLAGGAPGFASGAVEPSAEQIAAYEAADTGTRVKILILLAKNGNHAIAKTFLERYPLEGPFAHNRILFIEGLILKAEGDLTGAAGKYRDALADDPKLTLVRSELAKVLVQLEQDDSARHHLELLAADAPDQEQASSVRSFMDQISDRRPYSFGAYVSFIPSSNLNNGTANTKVYVPWYGQYFDIVGREPKSGIGAAVGGNASYNKRLGNDFRFIAAGSGEARIYNDQDFNSLSLSQSLELRYVFERGYLGLGAVASQALDYRNTDISSISYGPRLSGQFRVTPRDSVSASTVYEWTDVDANGSRESTNWTSDISITHAFDSSFNVSLLGSYEDITVEASGVDSYHTWSGGLSVYKELPFGVSVNATGKYRSSKFDEMNIGLLTTREDKRLIGNLLLTKRDLNFFGFAPQFSYTYIHNNSNIVLYDFDSHSIDFRLTKDF